MMTRKDYVEIAAILNDNRKSGQDCDEEVNETIDDIACEIAAYCAEDNERFAREKFLKASGMTIPDD